MANDFSRSDERAPLHDGGTETPTHGADTDGNSDVPAFPRTRGEPRKPVAAPPLNADRGFRAGRPSGETLSSARADVREKAAGDFTDDETKFRIGGFSLPRAVSSMSSGRKLWFAISFVAPVLIGGLYLFLVTPDQYVTEYRFSVRVPVGQSGSIASAGASLSALFGGNPTPGTDLLDNYTIADYVSSAQAASDLNAKVNLREMYNKPFDPFSQVGGNASAERLAKFWQSMVYSNYDAASGLAVVRVRAYSPQDSYAIATSLVTLSSDLVNSIGTQSQQDSVRFAQAQMERATARVAALRAQMVRLRRDHNVVDPDHGAVLGNEALLNSLLTRKSQIEAQAATIMAQLHNPAAPQMILLRQQLTATDQQIAAARSVVGTGEAGANLAITVGQFEDLDTQLKNANTVLTTASNVLSQIQAGADAQRLYLTTYVKPTLAQTAQAPDRWLDLLLITFIAAMVWIIGRLIGNSILEHG